MTEIQDGDVVIVGALVQAQVNLQRVFELKTKKDGKKKNSFLQIVL